MQTIFFLNNTPGENSMSKPTMENIQEIGITKLKQLFNHALSIEYFPNQFKTAMIKLIPKTNTDLPIPYQL